MSLRAASSREQEESILFPQLQTAQTLRRWRLGNIVSDGRPVRDIIYDMAPINKAFPALRLDLIRLTNGLSEGSVLGAPMLVDGRSANSDGYEFFLNQNGIIPVLLPLTLMGSRVKQRGVDFSIETLILETTPLLVDELLLVSPDGEHFAAPLKHVKESGVRVLVGAIPNTSHLLLEVADTVIPLEEQVLQKYTR